MTELRSAEGHHNDCAGERSEQGISVNKPRSTNAVPGRTALTLGTNSSDERRG
jgi:hypothetical protein